MGEETAAEDPILLEQGQGGDVAGGKPRSAQQGAGVGDTASMCPPASAASRGAVWSLRVFEM